MKSSASPAPATRSLLITVLGWLVAIGGALFSVISFFALLMILVGKDGTQTSDVTGFFLVVVAPPLTALAGVGLALRWRWAWYYLVVGLALMILSNAVEIVSHPGPSETTTVSPTGLKTTVIRSGPIYSLPVLVFAAGLLTLLLIPRVRREFASTRRPPLPPSGQPASTAFPPNDEREVARGWRVGHQGRDRMYYEERHPGTWLRIDLSGEMLMGRAHHVIYFPSVTAWEQLPEWARYRRDEIMARIQSEFRAPDYEYAEDVVPAARSGPGSINLKSAAAMQRCTPQQMLALVAVVALLLGVAGYMGWKVMGGLDTWTVTLPIPKASLQRPVLCEQEPALFWFSIGIYAVSSAGALALARWLGVQGWRLWRAPS